MSDSFSNLTQAELLAVALDASRRNDSGRALVYLKEAASRADASAQALFMLGSEYAQLGLTTEAKASMAKAVELGPGFPLARFQLGMLHVTSGETDAAKAAWAPLANLDGQHPQVYLAVFHRAMLHLVADEFDAALRVFAEGVALNKDNEALNRDMRRIVDAIEHLPGRVASGADPVQLPEAVVVSAEALPGEGIAADAESEIDPGHLFISAYKQGSKPH